MKIEITEKEELGTIRNTAITLRVEHGEEVFALETVLSEMYENNIQTTDYEVAEFTWLTPPPDSDAERVNIEEEAEKFILKEVCNETTDLNRGIRKAETIEMGCKS